MDLKSLQRKAKQLIDKRGGTESLKADAEELRDVAKGPGSSVLKSSTRIPSSGAISKRSDRYSSAAKDAKDAEEKQSKA